MSYNPILRRLSHEEDSKQDKWKRKAGKKEGMKLLFPLQKDHKIININRYGAIVGNEFLKRVVSDGLWVYEKEILHPNS